MNVEHMSQDYTWPNSVYASVLFSVCMSKGFILSSLAIRNCISIVVKCAYYY